MQFVRDAAPGVNTVLALPESQVIKVTTVGGCFALPPDFMLFKAIARLCPSTTTCSVESGSRASITP
jgi:hypothetical protein